MFKTKQKSLILDVINKSHFHPSAYEIYKECQKTLPNISLGTVYRNLNSLSQKGKIKALHMEDNTLRYDRIDDEHYHFICNKCNKIYDVNHKINLSNIENEHQVIDYELTLKGICKNCLKTEEV